MLVGTEMLGERGHILQGDQSCLDVNLGKSDVPQRYLLMNEKGAMHVIVLPEENTSTLAMNLSCQFESSGDLQQYGNVFRFLCVGIFEKEGKVL